MSKEVTLVVPSIRSDSWDRFVKEWTRVGLFDRVKTVLIEDNPTTTKAFREVPDMAHLSWDDISGDLGDIGWIIPRRSDTVRSFGYYYAHRWTECRYILTLDDDCYPPTKERDGFEYQDGAQGFLDTHIKALQGRPKWFSTLTKAKPRGVPFQNLGKMENVIINHGLWTNVLDYDAPTQLANPVKEELSFDSRIVPVGQYFPMCGMNVMWQREYTVLMYHLLMGHGVKDLIPGVKSDELHIFPFDRFGDIWCGIFAKKIADQLGLAISTGLPYIHHDRASNPFTNLKKEANGLEVNEKLWEYVDRYCPVHPPLDVDTAYQWLGQYVASYDEFPQYTDYFSNLGTAMQEWANLFEGA